MGVKWALVRVFLLILTVTVFSANYNKATKHVISNIHHYIP